MLKVPTWGNLGQYSRAPLKEPLHKKKRFFLSRLSAWYYMFYEKCDFTSFGRNRGGSCIYTAPSRDVSSFVLVYHLVRPRRPRAWRALGCADTFVAFVSFVLLET